MKLETVLGILKELNSLTATVALVDTIDIRAQGPGGTLPNWNEKVSRNAETSSQILVNKNLLLKLLQLASRKNRLHRPANNRGSLVSTSRGIRANLKTEINRRQQRSRYLVVLRSINLLFHLHHHHGRRRLIGLPRP